MLSLFFFLLFFFFTLYCHHCTKKAVPRYPIPLSSSSIEIRGVKYLHILSTPCWSLSDDIKYKGLFMRQSHNSAFHLVFLNCMVLSSQSLGTQQKIQNRRWPWPYPTPRWVFNNSFSLSALNTKWAIDLALQNIESPKPSRARAFAYRFSAVR